MKLPTLSYTLLLLCAGLCCPDDGYDDSLNYSFETDGLVEIENDRNSFEINDTIWIKTEVPITLENNDGIFNISSVAGNTDRLYTFIGLYEVTNFENPLPLLLSGNEVFTRKGEISIQYGLTATAFLEQDLFVSEFGIILKEPGSYFLSSHFEPGKINLYVETSNRSSIHIITGFSNSVDPYKYEFIVQ